MDKKEIEKTGFINIIIKRFYIHNIMYIDTYYENRK